MTDYAPLAGVRVLELATHFPGPLLTRKLGDLGADVVKVEPPDGDDARRFPPIIGGRSVLFEAANRGKRSIVLDLRRPDQRRTFLELAGVADAVVESYRPGALVRLGVDWTEIRRQRPELVVCSFSGFGQDGPLADLPAHGLNVEALAGCAVVGDDADGDDTGPSFQGHVAWSIELAAVNGALATATAVLHARCSGQGVWLDVSAWDAGVEAQRWALYPMLAGHRADGLGADRGPFYALYRAGDGRPLVLMIDRPRFWERFCRCAGRPDLLGAYEETSYFAPEASEDAGTGAGRHWLREEIAAIIATEPASAWTARFAAEGVPGCEVLDPDDVLAHPHLEARGLIGTSPDSGLPCIGDPVRVVGSDQRLGVDAPGAPMLDADHRAVLTDWLK